MKRVTLNQTYQIDFSSHRIKNLKSGTDQTLEPRLIQLLRILVDQEGQVVPRKMIIEKIWGNYSSGDELLTHSICLIRNALEKSIILTVPKNGYVLVADVSHGREQLDVIRRQLTFKRVAAVLFVLMMLKMIFFPRH